MIKTIENKRGYKMTSYKRQNGSIVYTIEKSNTPIMQSNNFELLKEKFNTLVYWANKAY
tara:strand:- start:1738 stop:1914 length:177 start_codon:yes stop_codon:yes gene_type:complete